MLVLDAKTVEVINSNGGGSGITIIIAMIIHISDLHTFFSFIDLSQCGATNVKNQEFFIVNKSITLCCNVTFIPCDKVISVVRVGIGGKAKASTSSDYQITDFNPKTCSTQVYIPLAKISDQGKYSCFYGQDRKYHVDSTNVYILGKVLNCYFSYSILIRMFGIKLLHII